MLSLSSEASAEDLCEDRRNPIAGIPTGRTSSENLSPGKSPKRLVSGPSISTFVSNGQARATDSEIDGGELGLGPILAAFVLQVNSVTLCPELLSHHPSGSLPFSNDMQKNIDVLISLCFPEGKWMGKLHKIDTFAPEEPVHGVYTDLISGNRHYIAGIMGGVDFSVTILEGLAARSYSKGDYIHQAGQAYEWTTKGITTLPAEVTKLLGYPEAGDIVTPEAVHELQHRSAWEVYLSDECVVNKAEASVDAAAFVAKTVHGTDVEVIMLRGAFSCAPGHEVTVNMNGVSGPPSRVMRKSCGASLPICVGLVSDIPMIRSGQTMVRCALSDCRSHERSMGNVSEAAAFYPTASMLWEAMRSNMKPLQELRDTGCLLVTEMYKQLGLGRPAWSVTNLRDGTGTPGVNIAALPARLMYSLCSDVPIRPLFDCFSIETLLEILALVLSGEQVVLSARQNHRLLPWVMEGIRALAGPFMRICPQAYGYHAKEEVFEGPVPFFLGWNAHTEGGARGRHNLRVDEHLWQYSLDTGKRERPEQRKKTPVELPATFRERILRGYEEMRVGALRYEQPRHSYTVNFVNRGDGQTSRSFFASLVSNVEFGQCIEVEENQFLDLKHGIVALFFVEFVRLVQGYDDFIDDLRARTPDASRFLSACRDQQRRHRQDIFFLDTFLNSQVWAQYLYELDRVLQWMQSHDGVPGISQEWGLPVALFHELCGRANHRQLHDELGAQGTCRLSMLLRLFGVRRV